MSLTGFRSIVATAWAPVLPTTATMANARDGILEPMGYRTSARFPILNVSANCFARAKEAGGNRAATFEALGYAKV